MRRCCLNVLLISAVISQPGCTDRTQQQALKNIKVAQFGDFFLYAPLYVAIDSRLLERRGLSVTVVNTGGDENTWAAVLSGEAQFGVADPTFVAVAGERGRPGLVIASLVQGVPFWGVSFDSIPPASSDVQLRELLANKTVATFPSPSTAFTLQRRLAEELGVTPKIREVAPGNLLATVQAGEADIALELEPTVSQAVSQGATVLYGLGERYREFVITGVTVTPEYLKAEPSAVQEFVCGIGDALELIRSTPDSAITLLLKRFPIPRDVATNALNRVISGGILPDSTYVGKPAWDAATALRTAAGDLKKPAPWTNYVHNVGGTSSTQCVGDRR